MMDHKEWHDRWADNRIGFHAPKPNRSLARYIKRIAPSGRVFLPLCGKTLDIGWLLENGYSVVGAELSEIAIDALFSELGLSPEIETHGNLLKYSAPRIDVFVGDIFELERQALGPVDAVYDRAALVALPPDIRAEYAPHVSRITDHAPQLLISFEYDQTAMNGPPHSVPAQEIYALYETDFRIDLLEQQPVPGGLKGSVNADEVTWKFSPKA